MEYEQFKVDDLPLPNLISLTNIYIFLAPRTINKLLVKITNFKLKYFLIKESGYKFQNNDIFIKI